jgi:hypothetical protein
MLRGMDFVHIFGPEEDSEEGLWAVEYEPGTANAFDDLWDFWTDAERVRQFCKENLEDLRMKFGYNISVQDAAYQLMTEAQALMDMVVDLAKGRLSGKTLQEVFKPLHNWQPFLQELQLSKASVRATTPNPKLRIYGIRLNATTFVVTGGAIKLTNKMEERPHTLEELKKLQKVQDWLRSSGVCFPEDLNDLA